jgi:Na+/proline symporter
MPPEPFSGVLGFGLMVGLGAFLLGVASATRAMVRNTHNFVIAGRRIGFGFGVGSVISVWTWSMAVMMSSAQAYTWGTSGLLWFVVPNGLAVVVMVPFARKLRSQMPHGYTIVEFVRSRFSSRIASTAMLLAMLFGLLCEIFINLYGVVLVMGVIFHLNATVVLLVTLLTVMTYSYFGGLWTSAITGTLNTLLITVPAAVIVLYVLAKAGGPDMVFQQVSATGSDRLAVFNPKAAAGFGISLALGLLASTMADQTFWQKAWALKPATMSRTFLWAGIWFYPIPLTVGLLGLVGTARGVSLNDLGKFGSGAIGPYVISHIGLPVVLIVLYVLVILNACFSSMDGAFSALSSLIAVDVVKRIRPNIAEKRLFTMTKMSILVAGIVGGIIVSAGVDYVELVNTVFFIKAVLIFPLGLAIFWRRMTAHAFVASIVLGLAAGLPIRQSGNQLLGIIVLEGVSLLVAVAFSLLGKERFDYAKLSQSAAHLIPSVNAPQSAPPEASTAPAAGRK